MSLSYKKFLIHICFFIFSVVILLPILDDSYVIKANDLNGHSVHHLYFRDSILKEHTFPQWNPYMVQGIPSIADPIWVVYNPLFSIPLLLFEYNIAIKVIIIISVFIACEASYFLFRNNINSLYISCMLALTYASGGFFAARITAGQIEKVIAYPLLPLMILTIQKTIQKKSVLWSGLSALTLSLIMFSGEVYFAAYTFYVLGVCVIYFFFKDRKVALYLLGTVILFALFSAIKIIPYVELQPFLEKVKDPYTGSQSIISIIRFMFIPFDWPFQLSGLMKFISPAWSPWEKYAFIGPVSFIGILWVMRKIKSYKKPVQIVLPLSFLVFICIAMPAFILNPLHWLIEYIPTLQYFRVPPRVFAYMSIIILIFLGHWCVGMWKKNLWKKIILLLLMINVVSTTIFFYGITLQNPLVVKEKISPIDYSLYNNAFSWIQKNNQNFYYVLAVNHVNEVPVDSAYFHKTMLLNTNYGFLIKNTPAANYAFVNYPPPSNYNDVLPGFVVVPRNVVRKLPWNSEVVYKEKDLSVFRVLEGRPFASITNKEDKSIDPIHAIINANKITVNIDSTKSASLTLIESKYPGWKVYMDGIEKPLENDRFLTVNTLPGRHTYTFIFSSTTFKIGAIISCISIAGWVVFILYRRKIFLFN